MGRRGNLNQRAVSLQLEKICESECSILFGLRFVQCLSTRLMMLIRTLTALYARTPGPRKLYEFKTVDLQFLGPMIEVDVTPV